MSDPTTTEPPARFFYKELASRPLMGANGRRIYFLLCGDDEGVLTTRDPALIAELEDCVKRSIGGVLEITADEFETLKKKPPLMRSANSFVPQALPKRELGPRRPTTPVEVALQAAGLELPAAADTGAPTGKPEPPAPTQPVDPTAPIRPVNVRMPPPRPVPAPKPQIAAPA